MKVENFTVVSRDGLKINAGSWSREEDKAIICIVHGIGEHFKRYMEMVEYLSSHGFTVFAYDQRGHGNSQGKRGHSPSYAFLLDDVENIMKAARSQFTDLPIFLYGHSWGGNIVANFILKRKTKEISGAILSSPWLDLKQTFPPLLLSFAKFGLKIFPSLLQNNRLVPDYLSKDAEVVKSYIQDPLVHPKISLATYFQTTNQGKWALEHAHKINIPLLIMHGSADLITSWEASKKFYEKVGRLASFKLWEGVKHEPHHDLEKHDVLKYMVKWLNNNVPVSQFD